MKKILFCLILLLSFASTPKAQTVQYTYDNLYRLTSIDYGNGTTTSYSYDANGNRVQQVNASAFINYVFTGSGNWSNAANWQNSQKPPTTLPTGYTIVINPAGSGECILDVNQTIAVGASFTVATGKKFRIPGNLQLNKQ